MKKITIPALILSSLFLLSGCGQDLEVTVYNTTGITYMGAGDPTWVQMTANLDCCGATNNTLFPSGVAATEGDCDSFNSFTIKAKENQTLNVYAQGWKYEIDSLGTTTLAHFESGPTTKLLYGNILSTPHWYAAIFVNNIVIYCK